MGKWGSAPPDSLCCGEVVHALTVPLQTALLFLHGFLLKKIIPLQAWPINVLKVKHVNILTDVKEIAYMPAHVIECFGGSGQNAKHIVESRN